MEPQELNALLPTQVYPEESVPHYSKILTADDQANAIAREITRLKDHLRFRLRDKGCAEGTILQKISETDWLSLVDQEAVLTKAAKLTYWEMQDEIEAKAKVQAEMDRLEKVRQQFTASFFYGRIKHYFLFTKGVFLEDDIGAIKAICFFVSRDPRFETELGFSFKKGLLLVGDPGIGKTQTIKSIHDNPVCPIRIFNMIDITNVVRQQGYLDLDTNQTIMLDDVGSEVEMVKHYGNQVNWFKEFIESYYAGHQTFEKLIVTTNFDGQDIENRYSNRVRSRMREMFNQIKFKGNDKRK